MKTIATPICPIGPIRLIRPIPLYDGPPVKRLHDLRPADFERAAVWHYDGQHDDVATVRATERGELAASDPIVYIARTQFALANGAQFIGFCSPGEDDALAELQPVILTSEGPVYFYFEEPPSQEMLDAQWRRLGVGHEQVFPVHFRCTVPVDGVYVTGSIEAEDLTGAA